ncbi:beta-lactamase family protein [Nakamurella flavida]|uniref:Beta-lactamase family protein n=1 Tax=Nakamurella flavida TaxID=363630 RepID=A0A939C216_9ACTN|nr:serine hydrolase domain-containing protein [Nakamurella flavida]MBM9478273.1 beta-lactamase family protein [Nakamurella flavida]MDP9777556.1 D-alanyl-D-alanine carboxypeptidase [Nakamurella flavida]
MTIPALRTATAVRPGRRRLSAAALVAVVGLTAGCTGAAGTGRSGTGAMAAGSSTPPASSAATAAAMTSSAGTSATTATSGGSASTSVFPVDLAAAVDAAAQKAISESRAPGVIVRVSDDRGVFEKAYGTADPATGTPATVTDYFRIGSNTKTMVVTTMLLLVDQGRINLDAPIGDLLPDLPEQWRSVTARQLAEMRSGIPAYTGTQAFLTDFEADHQRAFTVEELLAYVADADLSFAPGTDFAYSNTNLLLVGMLVERASGRTVADNLQDLFDKAGLTHTSYPLEGGGFPEPHLHGFSSLTADGSRQDTSDWSLSWGRSAGAAVSTAEDLATWVRILADGSLLSPDLQRQRLAVVPIPGNPDDDGYGMGIVDAGGWIGHSGDTAGYSSQMYTRADGATLIVLAATDDAPQPGADGRVLTASAAIAEAVSAVLTPQTPFHIPEVG